MAEDEVTEEVSIDEDVPVDDVLSDAQDTLSDVEGSADGGDDLDAGAGIGGGTDVGGGRSAPSRESTATGTSSSGGGLLPSMPSDLFSGKHFLGAAALAAAGAVLGGIFVPIPILGSVVGLFLAGFLLGAASGRSSYVEVGVTTGVAGTIVAGLVSIPLLAMGGLGLPVFAVGAVAALLVGVLGHYFGRDLRSGLTRDVGGDDGPL